jgi:hypothetical protein
MAVKNLYSLGLLRNGKVYGNKQIAEQAMLQSTPDLNDGVAKLCRYLGEDASGNTVVKTLIGFYANANEMEDNGGGQSYYTILDVEGSAADIDSLKEAVSAINETIGDGISGITLTDAINDINDRIGSGFSEDFTVADALAALADELEDKLKVEIDDTTSSSEYIIKQGGIEIGRIKKDVVVDKGSVVHGTWVDEDTFVEDPDGPDTAIKLELVNGKIIYINTKDLVDTYTAGNGIDITNNVVSIKYNTQSEEFLVVDGNGIRVEGIQAAIDAKADEERLEASDGISIDSKKVKAVAAEYSAPSIKNPITVDEDGIKFANILDCGFFDD